MCLLSCFAVDKYEKWTYKNISPHSSEFDKIQNKSPQLKQKADPSKESAEVQLYL